MIDEDTLIVALATRIHVLEDALHTLEDAAVAVSEHADYYGAQDVVIPAHGAPDDPAYEVKGWELRRLHEAWWKAQDALFPEQAGDAYARLSQAEPA